MGFEFVISGESGMYGVSICSFWGVKSTYARIKVVERD
jgi:hypothetical protein